MKEKQIRELRKEMEAWWYSVTDSGLAEWIYNAGYRKQSEGEWKINSDGYYPYCPNCNTEPKNGVMSNFCPNCGAKMKGEK